MYKKLIIPILMLCFFETQAQGLTEKYVSFDLSLTRSSFEASGESLGLSFSENSIRELAFDFEKSLEQEFQKTGLDIGFKFGKYKGLSYSLFMDITPSDIGKFKFGVSAGYNFAIPLGIYDLLIRPSVAVSTANINLDIGEIAVDTFGIVIDDTDYIDRTVNISVFESLAFLTPRLEATFLIEQKIGISLSAAYDIPFSRGEQTVRFTAQDFDSTSLSFDDNFHDFTLDGILPEENIFVTQGLLFSLGISWYYNRE